MTRSHFKEKFQEDFHDFSETLNQEELTFAQREAVFTAESESFFKKYDWLIKGLKQIFIFLPSAFILHFLSMVFGIFLTYNPPFSMQPIIPYFYFVLLMIFSFAAIWFALGNLRKGKHSLIPFSLVATSGGIGLLLGLMMNFFPSIGEVLREDLFPLCTFSLALIMPFITKLWLEAEEYKNEDNDNSK